MKKATTDSHDTLKRRSFLKGMSALGASALFPCRMKADINFDTIKFDNNLYNTNNAQTIIIYLYGGPSELAGNLTNLTEINQQSQNPYPLGSMTVTPNSLWAEAGGTIMESLLAEDNTMSLFRTCFRTVDDLKAHGECTAQAQLGKETEDGAGILSNLAAILYNKGAISEPGEGDDIGKSVPFVTMEGESTFFNEDDLLLASFLKPVALGTDGTNPYRRNEMLGNHLLNRDENRTLSNYLDDLAQSINPEGKIKDAFSRRALLEQFNDEINALPLPEGVSYPENSEFADRLEMAMKLLIHNEHTKVVSLGSPGLGGWDDHSGAINNYTNRMQSLFEAIESAVNHMNVAGRTNINIVVFGEFGRNVNYNNSYGWDHGNTQNVYWLGGSDYMGHRGIVGETELTGSGAQNRLYLQPKNLGQADESEHFQVFSIAATIYKMYGITNPEVLTNGNEPIASLLPPNILPGGECRKTKDYC